MFNSLESYVETDSFVITNPSPVELILDHAFPYPLRTISKLLIFFSPLCYCVRFEFLICQFELIDEFRSL